MRKIYTLIMALSVGVCAAQVPTNFGSDAGDGILYTEYNLIDHGTVSSVRFQAQNAIDAGDAEWQFFTNSYVDTWRPYTADDTLSGYDAIIDPSVETASARYNSNGGQTGRLQAIQAGYYYTCIIGNNVAADNFMSIIETDFDPVVIDTVYHSPENPVTTDNVTLTVELDGALVLSAGERVFIRSSEDGWVTSQFLEITNFSNGVGSFTVPGGFTLAGTTIEYYALVTEETDLVHETVDYFTLFYGNNDGDNYSFTVSAVTGIEDVAVEYGIIQNADGIVIGNTAELSAVELISMDGRLVFSGSFSGARQTVVSTSGLAKGIYVLNLIGTDAKKSMKVFVD